jgi:hypothetical protein
MDEPGARRCSGSSPKPRFAQTRCCRRRCRRWGCRGRRCSNWGGWGPLFYLVLAGAGSRAGSRGEELSATQRWLTSLQFTSVLAHTQSTPVVSFGKLGTRPQQRWQAEPRRCDGKLARVGRLGAECIRRRVQDRGRPGAAGGGGEAPSASALGLPRLPRLRCIGPPPARDIDEPTSRITKARSEAFIPRVETRLQARLATASCQLPPHARQTHTPL